MSEEPEKDVEHETIDEDIREIEDAVDSEYEEEEVEDEGYFERIKLAPLARPIQDRYKQPRVSLESLEEKYSLSVDNALERIPQINSSLSEQLIPINRALNQYAAKRGELEVSLGDLKRSFERFSGAYSGFPYFEEIHSSTFQALNRVKDLKLELDTLVLGCVNLIHIPLFCMDKYFIVVKELKEIIAKGDQEYEQLEENYSKLKEKFIEIKKERNSLKEELDKAKSEASKGSGISSDEEIDIFEEHKKSSSENQGVVAEAAEAKKVIAFKTILEGIKRSQNRIRVCDVLCKQRLSIPRICDLTGVPSSSVQSNIKYLLEYGVVTEDLNHVFTLDAEWIPYLKKWL